ncbi:MAG: hypothetical protein HY327_10185 [Chloroflexi bacterium]|nr:hypothetical protein [Chloroflexota bacterium]
MQRFIGLLLFLSACAPLATPTRLIPPTREPTAAPTLTPTLFSEPISPLPASETATPLPSATLAPPVTPARISYDKNPRALLIEADISGGFAPTPRNAHVTAYRLYADGLVVFAGERVSPASGLDAVVKTGFVSEKEIQALLNSLNQASFFSLDAHYHPKPAPTDMPTWSITVYLNKAKNVSVYAAGFQGTPQNFMEAFGRIAQTRPADAQTFAPSDGYLQATLAGASSDFGANVPIGEWTNASVKLADAGEGITIAAPHYAALAALVSRQYPNTLFREGERVYRVRFAPNLPRAFPLTDWIGPIVSAPREFDGRTFEVVGYYRGANILGEAQGNPPKSKSDWVIADATGAMYVTGAPPAGFDLNSPRDVWNVVRLRATVVYVRLGTSYLEARRVEKISVMIDPTPTSALIANADAAIATVKSRYPEVAKIGKAKAGIIGGSTDITVIERSDGWDLVFWEGWDDCPAGCINNRYAYFSVKKDGHLQKAGEYTRIHNAATNSFAVTGAAMWGIPKP